MCIRDSNYHIPGEYEFDVQEERTNLRAITRNYGKIKTNEVEKWEDELYSIESHLLVLNELFEISSYETKKIIHIVINRLFDLKNGYTSDYTDYAHEDILSLADGLEQDVYKRQIEIIPEDIFYELIGEGQ